MQEKKCIKSQWRRNNGEGDRSAKLKKNVSV